MGRRDICDRQPRGEKKRVSWSGNKRESLAGKVGFEDDIQFAHGLGVFCCT